MDFSLKNNKSNNTKYFAKAQSRHLKYHYFTTRIYKTSEPLTRQHEMQPSHLVSLFFFWSKFFGLNLKLEFKTF